MEESPYPHQGEIYLIRALKTLEDTKKRILFFGGVG